MVLLWAASVGEPNISRGPWVLMSKELRWILSVPGIRALALGLIKDFDIGIVDSVRVCVCVFCFYLSAIGRAHGRSSVGELARDQDDLQIQAPPARGERPFPCFMRRPIGLRAMGNCLWNIVRSSRIVRCHAVPPICGRSGGIEGQTFACAAC